MTAKVQYFCVKRSEDMSEQVREQLEIIKDSVLKAVPATAIYLFGSHAYGEPNEHSDLDVYVVVPDKNMCGIDMKIDLSSDISSKIDMPMDLLMGDKDSFDYRCGAPTLERKIFRNGVKVYG
jgi:predicted nucleotidyltransferase